MKRELTKKLPLFVRNSRISGISVEIDEIFSSIFERKGRFDKIGEEFSLIEERRRSPAPTLYKNLAVMLKIKTKPVSELAKEANNGKKCVLRSVFLRAFS